MTSPSRPTSLLPHVLPLLLLLLCASFAAATETELKEGERNKEALEKEARDLVPDLRGIARESVMQLLMDQGLGGRPERPFIPEKAEKTAAALPVKSTDGDPQKALAREHLNQYQEELLGKDLHDRSNTCLSSLNTFLLREYTGTGEANEEAFAALLQRLSPAARDKVLADISFLETLPRDFPMRHIVLDHVAEWKRRLAEANVRARAALGQTEDTAATEETALLRERIPAAAKAVAAESWNLLPERASVAGPRAGKKATLVLQSPLPRRSTLNKKGMQDVIALQVSRDGRLVAANISGTLIVFEAGTGREVWRSVGFPLNGVLKVFDDKVLITSMSVTGAGNFIDVLDMATGGPLAHENIGFLMADKLFGESADGRYVALTSSMSGFSVVIFDRKQLRAVNFACVAQFYNLEDAKKAELSAKQAPAKYSKARDKLIAQYGIKRDPGYWEDLEELPALFKARPALQFNAKGQAVLANVPGGKDIPFIVPDGQRTRPLGKKDVLMSGEIPFGGMTKNRKYHTVFDQQETLHIYSLEKRAHVYSLAVDRLPPGGKWSLWDVLHEEADGSLLCWFSQIGASGQGQTADLQLIARLNPRSGELLFSYSPGLAYTDSITAFSLSQDNTMFLGTAGGGGYAIDLNRGTQRKVYAADEAQPVLAAFSGNGARLFLVSGQGELLLSEGSAPLRRIASGLGDVTALTTDKNGGRVWIAREQTPGPDGKTGRSALSLISVDDGRMLDGPASVGQVAALDYDPAADRASALTFAPGGAPGRGSEPGLWAEGACSLFPLFPPNQYGLPLECGRKLLAWSAKWGRCVYQSGEPKVGMYPFIQSIPDGRLRGLRPGGVMLSQALPATRAFFHESGQVVALAEDMSRSSAGFSLYSTESGSEILRMEDMTRHPLGIQDGAFLSGVPRLVTVGKDGAVRLWDVTAGREPVNILSWIFLANGNVLTVDDADRFDTPDIDALEGVHWTSPSAPGRALPLDVFIRDYYQPRLAEYVLSGRGLPDVPDISSRNLYQAGVAIQKITPDPGLPDRVSVTVAVQSRDGKTVQAVNDLKLFRDGRMVARRQGPLALKDGRATVTFEKIALPKTRTEVEFSAYAFNEHKVRSSIAKTRHAYTPSGPAGARLRLVAMGVNEFDNPAWNLHFAANDARAYSEILPRYLPLKEPADIHLLDGTGTRAKGTREALAKTLERLSGAGSGVLSGDRAQAAGPDDIVVLTIASHGLTAGNTFYVLPSDIPGTDMKVTPELLQRAISAEQLEQWLATLDAREVVLILDTCQSGAALGGEDFKPGPMGDKGLGQLAYDKSMRVLCATNENSAALEYDALEHGLLSFVLLREGLEMGNLMSGKPGATLKDWLRYGQQRTTELYASIMSGKGIAATRGKVLMLPEQASDTPAIPKTDSNIQIPSLGQEPYLFDFGGDSAVVFGE